MKELPRGLFGFRVEDVDRSLAELDHFHQLEMANLQQKIRAARARRNGLAEALSALQETEATTQVPLHVLFGVTSLEEWRENGGRTEMDPDDGQPGRSATGPVSEATSDEEDARLFVAAFSKAIDMETAVASDADTAASEVVDTAFDAVPEPAAEPARAPGIEAGPSAVPHTGSGPEAALEVEAIAESATEPVRETGAEAAPEPATEPVSPVSEVVAEPEPLADSEAVSVSEPAKPSTQQAHLQSRRETSAAKEAWQRPAPAATETVGSARPSGKVVRFRRRIEKGGNHYDVSGFWDGTDMYVHHQVYPSVPLFSPDPGEDAAAAATQANERRRVQPASGFFNYALTEDDPVEQTAAVANVMSRPALRPATATAVAAVTQEMAGSVPAEEARKAVKVVPASSGSQAVSAELTRLREKYIAGKIAGADLFDEHGVKIIAKHDPITPEVIERANRAGKLAELIVQMTVPGLEVE